MKQSILVAALTVFVAFLANEANAQVFQKGACYSTGYCRVQLFPRLSIFSRCRFTTYAQPSPSTLTTTPEKVEFTPSCDGETCLVDPVGREEYYPTDEGNVPVERKTLLEIVNATRARYGLRALTVDAVLERGAIAQATFCSQIGGLRHAGGVAEILAQNTSDFNGAIAQWLNSPAHFAILTSSRYTRCGIGVVRDGYGRVWHAVQFR